jgi:DUF4097 and DUF4098 domain-containing protein YvlB
MQRSESIPIGGTTSARVGITMAVGDLRISGGAGDLMEADFTYDEELQPLIEHDEGDQTSISIRQDNRSKIRTTRNEWDIRLNDGVPVALTAGVAAADAKLLLDSLALHSLAVESAAGDATISAGGDQSRLERVSVDTASGDLKLHLNGSYASMLGIEVQSAAGDVDLDLGGQWQGDVTVTVNSVAGDVEITVPSSTGVSVATSSMVGRVKLNGFRRSEHGQVNAAFGTSDVTLRIKVTTISGSITVRETG